jgi:transposase-like protein
MKIPSTLSDIAERKILFEIWSMIGEVSCPYCGNSRFYFMTRRRLRCRRCRQDFWPLKGTWFSQTHLDLHQWTDILHTFIQGLSVQKASQYLKMNYLTVSKAYLVIRKAIFTNEMIHTDPVWDFKNGEPLKPDDRGKPLILAVNSVKGKIFIRFPDGVTANNLIEEEVAMQKRGGLIFTERWKNYNTLLISAPLLYIECFAINMKKKPVIDSNTGDFISYLMNQLLQFPRISERNIIFYIIEMQWRFNNRYSDLYPLLLDYMARKMKDTQ